ncbi:hypothetical protein ANCCEY_02252 [Ancylostoma ceylanicum]|uniref:Mediator of RNA polymerase II transcription subunit 24 n=1 Tax=Ancylostoma ceylanicum TaxID=53326 RepID=A0A0D6M3B9_9BILA|nr:hypothetical protein ANCCEY_02252 [Ancylostoma ceylanicum]
MVAISRPAWISDVVCRLWGDRGSLFDLSSQLREQLSTIKPQSAELRLLAQEFFQTATMTSHPDQRMLECIKMLAHSELISWTDFLRTVTGFAHFQKSRCVVALCALLESELPHLQCPFSHISDCLAMTEAVIDVFVWIVEGILASRELDDFEVVDVEGTLFQTFTVFLSDPFVFRLMSLATKKYGGVIKSSIINRLDELQCQDGVTLNYEELLSAFQRIFDPPKYESSELTIKYNFVADTMLLFGQINAISHHEIVSDMLHASFMILLEEQETRDNCKSSIEMFFYVKMPRVWAAMIKLGMQPESVVRGVQHMVSECRQVIDNVDSIVKDNTIRAIVRQLISERVMSDADGDKLIAQRNEQLKMIQGLACLTRDDVQRQTQVAVVLSAVQARHVIDKLWNMQEKLMTVLTRLIGSGGYAFDAFCSSYGLEGTLAEMSSKLASLNLLSESPSNVCVDRNMTFDLSFTMLTRIVYKYSNLTLDELVRDPRGGPDNTACAFYQWSSRYVKRISCHSQDHADSDLPIIPPELKAAYKDRVLRLKERQLFWDPHTCNYGQLLHEMPIVGEVPSEARRQMARCIKMVLEESVPDEKEEKDSDVALKFVSPKKNSSLQLMVDFMMDKKSQVMLMSVWIIDREYKKVNAWRSGEPRQKRAKIANDSQIHPSIKILQETIEVAVNKFVKESSQGSLYQPISSVCHIVRMIAGAPESEAKQLLLPYLKHLLVGFFLTVRDYESLHLGHVNR